MVENKVVIIKDSENKKRWIVDEEAAKVVRENRNSQPGEDRREKAHHD